MARETKDVLNRLLGEYRLVEKQCKKEQEQIDTLTKRVDSLQECQTILQTIARSVQERSHKAISDLVTRCLKAIFGEDAYEFRIKFEQRRGRTEADLVFVRDGKEVDPTTATGGGVVDVATIALRLACLVLSRPKRRKLLVLDEPTKHLSKDHSHKVRHLIEELAKELDIQFLIVTHDPALACGKVVEL